MNPAPASRRAEVCRAPRSGPYYGRMFADLVWHYWLAVALVIPAFLLVFITIIGYVRKVIMPRYPRR